MPPANISLILRNGPSNMFVPQMKTSLYPVSKSCWLQVPPTPSLTPWANCRLKAVQNPNLAFNLIEIFGLIIPMEWWMSKAHYAKVNDCVMIVIYSPLLVVIAALESFFARKIQLNRRLGEEDDDESQEWEIMAGDVDYSTSNDTEWADSVQKTKKSLQVDETLTEIKDLKTQVAELTGVVAALVNSSNGGGNQFENTVRTGMVQPEGSLLDTASPTVSSSNEGEASGDWVIPGRPQQ